MTTRIRATAPEMMATLMTETASRLRFGESPPAAWVVRQKLASFDLKGFPFNTKDTLKVAHSLSRCILTPAAVGTASMVHECCCTSRDGQLVVQVYSFRPGFPGGEKETSA